MKRGQLEISFGMIFSIIIIIAVLAISFYVIQYFTNLTKCSTLGLFYEDIQKETNTAWQGTTSKSLFVGNVPSQVSYVCFGNMTISPKAADTERYNELRKTYRLSGSNSFMYPIQKSCSGLSEHNINHANIPEFFCIKQVGGKVKVSLEKGAFDNSVKFSST